MAAPVIDQPTPVPADAPAGAIYKAIIKVMQDGVHVQKARKNPQQGYAFRGIDDFYNAYSPVLAANGIFVVPKVVAQHREERQTKHGGVLIYTILTVDHYFYAADGSHVVARTVGEAMDSGDKSSNKSMSAAMKYALIEVFLAPTDEPKDTEYDTPEPAPRHAPPPRLPAPARQPPAAQPGGDGYPGNDALADDDDFKAALAKTFADAGFATGEADAATGRVLLAKRVPAIEDLGLDDRHSFIIAISEGKFDKYKAAAPAVA